MSLSLWGNRISDLSPLSTLTGLNGLNLAGNAIADLSPLAGLTRLTSLNLGGNEISDLSPLAGLVSLTELKLYDNRIVDLSPLAGLIGLTELSLRGNEVEDVAPLADLANLKVLLLADNRIADISPLLDNPGLAEGDRVDLANNPLDMASVDTHAATLSARGIEVQHGARAQSLAAMFPTVADAHRQGFARIVNHSARAGEIRIEATDATGPRTAPLTLTVAGNETVHLNSNDLEWGNTDKNLAGTAGTGEGNWWLAFTSDLAMDVLSYIRTGDGFLTSMHDFAASDGDVHRVPIFNPASNTNQVSSLRLVNPGTEDASVSITGIDDDGMAGDETVSATVPVGSALMVSAVELETGGGEPVGTLGDGEGKWRLSVTADQPIRVMSLLASPTGHLTNLSTAPVGGEDGSHTVPLFPAAFDSFGREGFVRVVNRSDTAGEVTINAFDQEGIEYGPLTLALGMAETAHFNSEDLEMGNAEKGLSGEAGPGSGDWRLELTSEFDIDVLSYIRTSDGFLTAMHDLVPTIDDAYRVAIFNPATNRNQVSLLRLINPGTEQAIVTITAVDDRGNPGDEPVHATLPAGASRAFSAVDLEEGGEGLEGSLGDGDGKWRLAVRSDQPIRVMSLLSNPTGHLTNLSSTVRQ